MINRAFTFSPVLPRAAMGFAVLILVVSGCGVDPDTSDSTPSSTTLPTAIPPPSDDGNGDGNGNGGGGIVWPSLPSGPEIPQILEVYVYSVLAEANPSRCAALFSPEGVEVQAEGGPFVVSLVGATEFNFVTGDRTRLLYEAGARLCAGDETAARVAFTTAVGLGSWSTAAEDAATQTAVCTVWDTVAHLLDPGAGACTLEAATTDATESAGPSGTPGESADTTDDPAVESDAADATDAP